MVELSALGMKLYGSKCGDTNVSRNILLFVNDMKVHILNSEIFISRNISNFHPHSDGVHHILVAAAYFVGIVSIPSYFK
jgi:hypothetical protein